MESTWVLEGNYVALPEAWDHRKDRFGALNLFEVEMRMSSVSTDSGAGPESSG